MSFDRSTQPRKISFRIYLDSAADQFLLKTSDGDDDLKKTRSWGTDPLFYLHMSSKRFWKRGHGEKHVGCGARGAQIVTLPSHVMSNSLLCGSNGGGRHLAKAGCPPPGINSPTLCAKMCTRFGGSSGFDLSAHPLHPSQ